MFLVLSQFMIFFLLSLIEQMLEQFYYWTFLTINVLVKFPFKSYVLVNIRIERECTKVKKRKRERERERPKKTRICQTGSKLSLWVALFFPCLRVCVCLCVSSKLVQFSILQSKLCGLSISLQFISWVRRLRILWQFYAYKSFFSLLLSLLMD